MVPFFPWPLAFEQPSNNLTRWRGSTRLDLDRCDGPGDASEALQESQLESLGEVFVDYKYAARPLSSLVASFAKLWALIPRHCRTRLCNWDRWCATVAVSISQTCDCSEVRSLIQSLSAGKIWATET